MRLITRPYPLCHSGRSQKIIYKFIYVPFGNRSNNQEGHKSGLEEGKERLNLLNMKLVDDISMICIKA